MIRSFGVIHAIAQCLDCKWESSTYKNAQACSARHAQAQGHTVKGELGIAFSYSGAKRVKPVRR